MQAVRAVGGTDGRRSSGFGSACLATLAGSGSISDDSTADDVSQQVRRQRSPHGWLRGGSQWRTRIIGRGAVCRRGRRWVGGNSPFNLHPGRHLEWAADAFRAPAHHQCSRRMRRHKGARTICWPAATSGIKGNSHRDWNTSIMLLRTGFGARSTPGALHAAAIDPP